MTDFLEDLGREIDLAVARRGAARRPVVHRRAAGAMGLALAALIALAVVVRTGDGRPEVEQPATVAPRAVLRGDLPAPPEALEGVAIAVANGTQVPGLAESIARRLRAAGWAVRDTPTTFTITGPGAADIADVPKTIVVYAGNHEAQADAIASALGLETRKAGGDLDLRLPPSGLALVLANDAAPRIAAAGSDDATFVVRRVPPPAPGGGICFQVQEASKRPSTRCGPAPTTAQPIGVVGVDPTLQPRFWFVYGLASHRTRTIDVGGQASIRTRPRPGLPGRFFYAFVPAQLNVSMKALDADGRELGGVGHELGTPTKPESELTSGDEAAAHGSLAAFAPSLAPARIVVYNGRRADPEVMTRSGVSCSDTGGPVLRCEDFRRP